MDAEKKQVIDEVIERLTNLKGNNVGQVSISTDTLSLFDAALSYAIEAAAERQEVKDAERFASAKVEDVSRHIRGLEELGDRAQEIAQSLRCYHKAIDEYVDAVTSAFRSGDIALVALKKKELLRTYAIAATMTHNARIAPKDVLDILQIAESDNG